MQVPAKGLVAERTAELWVRRLGPAALGLAQGQIDSLMRAGQEQSAAHWRAVAQEIDRMLRAAAAQPDTKSPPAVVAFAKA